MIEENSVLETTEYHINQGRIDLQDFRKGGGGGGGGGTA